MLFAAYMGSCLLSHWNRTSYVIDLESFTRFLHKNAKKTDLVNSVSIKIQYMAHDYLLIEPFNSAVLYLMRFICFVED